jgi:hypothetical protein
MLDIHRLYRGLVVTLLTPEHFSDPVSFVKVELQILLALAALRTDLTEKGFLLAMGILRVSFQLTRARKHHGAIHTRILIFVSFAALAHGIQLGHWKLGDSSVGVQLFYRFDLDTTSTTFRGMNTDYFS